MKFVQLLFAIAILAVSTTSCEQLNSLTIFDFKASPIVFILNETEAGEDISFQREIPINIQKELEDRGFSEKNIESIKPKTITLSLSDAGSDFDLNNVTSAEINVIINGTPQPIGMLVKEVDRNTNSVELEVLDTELREEILKGSITYKASFLTDAKNPQDAKVTIATTFAVDTKL